jgi:hypothetical protein
MPNPNWITTMMAANANRSLNLHLCQITVPMSHDAGVSAQHNSWKALGAVFPKNTYIAQDVDILGQLNHGARCFDLRFVNQAVFFMAPDIVSVHQDKVTSSGGYGEGVNNIFTSVVNFLNANPLEFVILRITQTAPDDVLHVQAAQQNILNPAGLCYHAPNAQTNVSQELISHLQGSAVVLYERNDNDIAHGYTRFAKTVASVNRYGITTCGIYAADNNISAVNGTALQSVNDHRHNCRHGMGPGVLSDHLSMVYWQITGGNIRSNTLDAPPAPQPLPDATAFGTHFNLPFLTQWLQGINLPTQPGGGPGQIYPVADTHRTYWVPNLINLDFINDNVCNDIIAFNNANLAAAGL